MSATADLPLTVSSVAPGSVPNSQPFLPSKATVTDTGDHVFELFQLAEDQRAMRPGAGERNVEVIAAGFGRKTTLAGRAGTAVRGDVIVENRRLADEPAIVLNAHINVSPRAIDKQAHFHLRLIPRLQCKHSPGR